MIAEVQLIRKVVALAHAGECVLARAHLDDAVRQGVPISPANLAKLRETISEVPEGAMLDPRDEFGWNELGATFSDIGKLR